LSPGGRNEYGQLECNEWWEFLTLRSWGEKPVGVWKLSITDTTPGIGDVQCVDRPGFSVPKKHTQLKEDLTCDGYKTKEFCVNGSINKDSMELANVAFRDVVFKKKYGTCPMKAETACCVCGGGIRPTDDELQKNQLLEWKIVLGDGSSENIYDDNIYEDDISNEGDDDLLNEGDDGLLIGGDDDFSGENTTDMFDFDDDYVSEEDEQTEEPEPVTEAPTSAETSSPTEGPSPKRRPKKPNPRPPKPIIPLFEEEDEEEKGFIQSITGFFGNLFNFGGDDDGEGGSVGEEKGTKGWLVWLITAAFSLMLLLRGSSLCDFHINFSREVQNGRRRNRNRNR